VSQAIEADTRSQAPEQFRLGCRILPEADPAHEIRVVQLNYHEHIFYV
jgi:hypothetical protein